MIPVDIDNFIITYITRSRTVIKYAENNNKSVEIKLPITYIPKEISNIKELTYLSLAGCNLENISGLSSCYSLKCLDLSCNKIVNISPLSNCTQLVILNLYSNKITDASALKKCKLLISRDLKHNPLHNKFI